MARQRSPRMRKVNELIREVVAEAVVDLKDPRIGFLTITGAETSPDLRHAVVYYSVLGTEEEKSDTADALIADPSPRSINLDSVFDAKNRYDQRCCVGRSGVGPRVSSGDSTQPF